MKKSINVLAFMTIAMCVNAYAENCPRNLESLSRTQRFELESMDRFVGSYRLSGNAYCKSMTITSSELCDSSRSDKSLATTYYLTVNGEGDQSTASLYYSIQPGSRSGISSLSIRNRKISMERRRNSGGGITSRYYKTTMNFDRHDRLESLDIVNTSGVIVQSVDFKTHCKVD